MKDNESLIIDYAKSIGIILVVMYHLKTGFFNVYHAYMYHMPLFFLLVEYCTKTGLSLPRLLTLQKNSFFILYTLSLFLQ